VTSEPEERMLAGLGRAEVRAQLEPSPLVVLVGIFEDFGELEIPFTVDQARELARVLDEVAAEIDASQN
jgi:hypothetical protein